MKFANAVRWMTSLRVRWQDLEKPDPRLVGVGMLLLPVIGHVNLAVGMVFGALCVWALIKSLRARDQATDEVCSLTVIECNRKLNETTAAKAQLRHSLVQENAKVKELSRQLAKEVQTANRLGYVLERLLNLYHGNEAGKWPSEMVAEQTKAARESFDIRPSVRAAMAIVQWETRTATPQWRIENDDDNQLFAISDPWDSDDSSD